MLTYFKILCACRSRIQASGCQFSEGTFGGSGGGSSNEQPDNCGAVVQSSGLEAELMPSKSPIGSLMVKIPLVLAAVDLEEGST